MGPMPTHESHVTYYDTAEKTDEGTHLTYLFQS